MDEATTICRDSGSGVASAVAPILTVIVPTLNERDNIEPLVALLSSAMPSTAWEAIFVDDDSPDGTSELVRALARHNPRIRCLQRIGRRGLATACVEGVLASASPYVAVMMPTFSTTSGCCRKCCRRSTAAPSIWWWAAGTSRGAASAIGAAGVPGLVGSRRVSRASFAKLMWRTR